MIENSELENLLTLFIVANLFNAFSQGASLNPDEEKGIPHSLRASRPRFFRSSLRSLPFRSLPTVVLLPPSMLSPFTFLPPHYLFLPSPLSSSRPFILLPLFAEDEGDFFYNEEEVHRNLEALENASINLPDPDHADQYADADDEEMSG